MCGRYEIELGDGATKIFLSTKGTPEDVDKDVKAFLDYVDAGIVSGEFVKEVDEAVQIVKTNRRGVKEFMTFEMMLLENRMAGYDEGHTEGRIEMGTGIALKMLRKGNPIDEISELPIERIKQIAAENSIAIKL